MWFHLRITCLLLAGKFSIISNILSCALDKTKSLQLSNIWWVSNLVSKGFATKSSGSSWGFQWTISQLPCTECWCLIRFNTICRKRDLTLNSYTSCGEFWKCLDKPVTINFVEWVWKVFSHINSPFCFQPHCCQQPWLEPSGLAQLEWPHEVCGPVDPSTAGTDDPETASCYPTDAPPSPTSLPFTSSSF